MTLSIAPVAGGSYYTGSSYYSEGQEKSQWGGGAKEALGLKDGPVHTEQLDMLFDGHVPDGNRIAKIKDGKWVSDPGRDFTFSAPKSVSILAQGPLREQIHAAMMRSADKAMQYGEKEFAATRITNSETGEREIVGNQKIVYALFLQETSRQNDPQLHVHGPSPNIALGEDGKFRALRNNGFYDNKVLIGQVFRAELVKDLKGMGLDIRETGQHGQFEVKGVDEKVLKDLSKRRNAMEKAVEPENRDAKTMANAALFTRQSKTNPSREELSNKWNSELEYHDTTFDEIAKKAMAAEKSREPDLRSIVKSTLNHSAETQRSVGKYELLHSVMSETYGHHTIDKVQGELERLKEKGTLVQDGKHYALATTLNREKDVISHLHKGHLQSKPILDKATSLEKVSTHGLTSGQMNGAALILSSYHRYVGLQGTAGTGKTRLLNTALPLAKEKGFKIIGIAPTGAATQELKETGQFDKTMTLQRYLLTPEGDRQTILVVDESSMVSTKQMQSLMHFANLKSMNKVVLIGDTRQMGAVAAGKPFQALQDAGLRTAHLNQVVRQKDVRHREAIQDLAISNIREGFEKLAPEIKETAKGNLENRATQEWHALKYEKAPIIVQTNRQKDAINSAIKNGIERDPGSSELQHRIFTPHHLTAEKKKFVKNYEGASHIRFNRAYKGLGVKSGDVFKIKSINQERAQITLQNGKKTIEYKPAKHAVGKDVTEVYREKTVSLEKGDRVRFTRGVKSEKINNNDFGFVKSVEGGKITVSLDRGKEKTLDSSNPAARYIGHAWANTAHAFQGKTVDNAIVVMPSKKSPLTTLNSLYVGSSRHRASVSIITDNKSRLEKNLSAALKTEKNQDKLFQNEGKAAKLPKASGKPTLKNVSERDLVKSKGQAPKSRSPAREDFGR